MPLSFIFQGSDDMVNWVDIEQRSTANHKWNTNEERVFWVGVPTGIPGIPQADFDTYNENPFGYGQSGDDASQSGIADRTNVCQFGDTQDFGRGAAGGGQGGDASSGGH